MSAYLSDCHLRSGETRFFVIKDRRLIVFVKIPSSNENTVQNLVRLSIAIYGCCYSCYTILIIYKVQYTFYVKP